MNKNTVFGGLVVLALLIGTIVGIARAIQSRKARTQQGE